MEEWKTYKYTELCTLVGGGTPKTTVPEYWDGNIPWLSVKDFGGGKKYVYTTEKTITELGLKNSTTKLLEKDDIIISARGTIGEIAMIPSDMAFNQSCFGIRAKADLIDPHYLYYLTKTKVAELKKASHGSVFDTITRDTFDGISCELPDLNTQKQVSQLLSSIDNKIELNNRINHNLEQQAQALYKSWFVDFEPFKGGKFVDSELGLIPEGWVVGCYNDIIDCTVAGDWGKEEQTGNYTHKVSCIRGCDFEDISCGIKGKTPERYILEKNFISKQLKNHDIIVEISGGTPTVSTGRICLVSNNLIDRYFGDIVCTNFCRVIRPVRGYSSFVYYSWQNKYDHKVMFGYENGTSGIKNFQIADFLEKELVIIPPQTVLADFQMLVNTYQAAIQRNGNERMKCEMVRDSLLPKLMSGELKINDLTC